MLLVQHKSRRSSGPKKKPRLIWKDLTQVLVSLNPGTNIGADSRNKIFVAPPIGNRMKEFSIRIPFFEPSNFGSLSPISFFFSLEGKKVKVQLRDMKSFWICQHSILTD